MRLPLQILVFAQGHVFHLGRDNAASGIVHLGYVASVVGGASGTAGLALQARSLGTQGSQRIGLTVLQAIVQCKGFASCVGCCVAPLGNPALAHGWQALAYVDGSSGIGVGARGVVHRDGLAIALQDFAQRYLNVRSAAAEVYLARGG